MSQVTNLNIAPYYDDFDASKNYRKVLFKPGYPIQSRELTTLQSILHEQIEKFGQHFFKEGSMVIPGGTIVDSSYFAVRIDPFFLNVPVKEYTKYLADNKIEIQGEISGVKATVVNRITDIESIDQFDTLYLKYTASGDDGVTKKFLDGENLITLSDIEYSNTRITANSTFARTIISDSVKTGSSASIGEGIFFIRGYFVQVPSSTVILDQYTNQPSYKVGLTIKEELVSASSLNSDLFDNAKGYSNETAPGADRFKISAVLSKKLLTDNDDSDFVELIRIENGITKEQVKKTEYNVFKDELARRTYDESGDYYIEPFSVDIRETLNNRIANRGLYFSNQITQNGNTPSDNLFTLQISEGKAYVRGYEIEKTSTTSIDLPKPRTTKSIDDVTLPIKIGNIVVVNNIFGTPQIGFSTFVHLLDKRLTAAQQRDLTGNKIGKARVYDFNQYTGTNYQLRLFDIETFTKVSLASTSSAVVGDHVEGKFSGSAGFVNEQTGTGSVLTLTDVSGEFQINEPILVNGIEVGSNIGTVSDFDFADIKAIHSDRGSELTGVGATSFAADLELSHSKQVFQTGAEFQISAFSGGISTVTGPSVSDFRSLVKVGDIISYSSSSNLTNVDPTFNRVSGFGIGGTNFTIQNVADVSGICNGGVVGNSSPTDIFVRVPFLSKGSNPGFLIPFKEENIASLNLLDSNYITRKVFKVNASGQQVVLNLSSHGDNLFFEPFSLSNYLITKDSDGSRFILREPQFAFSNNNRTLTISSLGDDGNVTVTATVKRTKFASIEKNITRCTSLVINKSNDTSSGLTTTTLNDGLTFSKVYGTRVQDEEISLNFPEIHRILGIFESDDNNDPNEPFFVVSSQSEGFMNNVIVGEQIIGGESGAVARVTDVTNDTKIKFVYENDKTFEVDELINLQISGIIATISKLNAGDASIIDNFILDNGQRKEFADYGRIIREKNATIPNRRIKIIFDHYSRSGITTNGTVESINSYNTLDYSNEIPTIDGKRASDVIDLRPRVAPYDPSSTKSPFEFGSRDFSASETESLVSNQSVVVDYSYYLGRIDRIYLTKDGLFDVDEGTPSRFPKPPEKNPEAFEIGTITLPPYLLDASTDTRTALKSHKRYTMKDINGLEHRIKTLEEYTTLSLLETDTKNLSIKDPNTGLDKFKSGFFVDNFTSHKKSSMNRGERNFDIDRETGECRPKSTERTVSLKIETKSSKADPVNADYAWITDFQDSNITRNAQGLTLKYDEVEFVNQPFATRVENLNPYHIALYAGSVALEPSVDYWIEEIPLGTPEVFEDTSAWDAMADMYGLEDRENGGMASSFWNSHEVTWSGREELIKTERLNVKRTVNVNTENQPIDGGVRRITTTTTNTKFDEKRTFKEEGEEREFGIEVTPEYQTINLGKKVIGTEIIYNCRSRNIEVTSTRLKPNTKFYVFMDNVDITSYCVPKLLQISMTRGTFTTGDIVESSIEVTNLRGFAEVPDIMFRVATENHKTGPFNAPTETYKNDPYTKSALSGSYSSSSTILNIDTAGLSLEVEPDQLGWVRKGMTLSSQNGNAEADISDLSLVTDEKGALTFSLHIPDPKVQSNPKFTTGTNTIRLTTSPTNASKLDPGECSAEATYKASGIAEITQEQILSIKGANIERKQIGDPRIVSRITEDIRVKEESTQRREEEFEEEEEEFFFEDDWYDPLAQSFLVESKYQDGIFVTGGNLYFKTKDDNVPVTVQIRTMRDGSPTTTIVPFGEMNIDPDDVKLSDDSSVPTPFKFPTPVYLKSGKEYALVLIAPTEKYNHFITRMGEEDLILEAISNQQPYLGSLFKSQNQSTWTPSQFEDLKFTLNKAKFVTNTPSSFIFYNNKLDFGQIRKKNPVTAYSKTQRISIQGAATPTFVKGHELKQGTNTGRIVSIGSSVTESTSGLTFETTTGVGLTNGTFTGIGASSVTGIGTGLEATVTVSGTTPSVNTITVTNGGTGYQIGDALVFDKVGNTGSTVRAFVDSVSNPNYLVVDQVDNNFVSSSGIVHIASDGTNTNIAANKINSVVSDPIKDGFTMEFDHRNHGMHGSNNKLEIKNFISDKKATDISEDILFDSTTITVEDATGLNTFEGTAVGTANTGYLQVGKEIIGYHGPVSGNVINGISERGVDSSLVSTHKAGKRKISKYEFNGVSLRKINKVHNIDGTRDRTFNSYYVKLDDTTNYQGNSLPFTRTKAGGGSRLRVSQNIPFEAIDPRVTMINPTGTSVSARIKTTSGSSVSGTEASFTDKGYEDITLNKLNILDDPRIVASKVNELNLLNNENSFALEVVLSSSKPDVSPMIDLNTPNIILISNLVDDQVSNYTEDRRSRVQGEEPNSAVYITNRINLEFPSNSLYVQFDGHKDDDSDFRVFYKLHRSDLPEKQVYNPFNLDGSPDTFVDPNIKYNGFSEYKYTAENLPQFTSFTIKVIMTSKNQANAPRFKNFRAIALRSFDVD